MNILHPKLALALGLGGVIATAAVATAYPGQQLAPGASIPIERARAIATHAAPGKIVSEELERESGGSGLRYSFDVKGSGGVREVGVDAKTGRLLENSADAPPGSSTNPEKGEGPEGSGD